MKNVYKLTFFLLALMSGVVGHAVPAIPTPIEMPKPDGTSIMVTLHGDERMHFYTTLDGYLLCETPDRGLVYAVMNEFGTVVASSVSASNISARSDFEQAFISKIDRNSMMRTLEEHRVKSLPAQWFEGSRTAAEFNPALPSNPIPGLFDQESPFPTKGSPKVLVILVNYADVHFTSESNHFHNIINGRNYTDNGYYGSVYDYYTQQSKGQFTPVFDILGPVTLSNTQAYYGGNDADGNDLRPREMVIEALKMLDESVDFSQYDNNNDGVVDNIYVFYAGMGEASGGGANTIWPHSWSVASMSPVLDGVKFDSYACSNEITTSRQPVAIGTFCHEFGHVLGLPDLYATAYTEAKHPGSWDLMASGSYNNNSKTPPNLSSFERGALGWLEPEWLHITGDYNMDKAILDSNKAYLIATEKNTEFFLIENRCNWLETWDDYTMSAGLLVWHVDYRPDLWAYNIVNNNPDHMCVDIVEAHGKNYPVGSFDCYPFGTHTRLAYETVPSLQSWSGRNLEIDVYDIADDEDTEAITFKLNGLSSVAGIGTDSLAYKLEGNLIEAFDSISIFSIDGRIVTTFTNGESGSLPAGLYIVVSRNDSSKIMIQ